ncbi:hypothetical protein ACY2DA_13370 [Staphylococcus simulans]
MNNKLPDNIIEFTAIQKGKPHKQSCDCDSSSNFIINEKHHTVYCKHCGGLIDPFRALVNLTNNHSLYQKQLEEQLHQAKVVEKYLNKYRHLVPRIIEEIKKE